MYKKIVRNIKIYLPNGSGMLKITNAKNGRISGTLEANVYAIDFFKLSNILRPSSTPVIMEAKLSSNRIISADCCDTSEPDMPMAIPISAFLRAGASFTPSPVTATERDVFVEHNYF